MERCKGDVLLSGPVLESQAVQRKGPKDNRSRTIYSRFCPAERGAPAAENFAWKTKRSGTTAKKRNYADPDQNTKHYLEEIGRRIASEMGTEIL